jgi:hypothetical protein
MNGRSATYADTLGADALTVLSGAQTIAGNVGGAAGQLKQFGFTLNFTAPFLYDPTLGDLVLDVYFPNDNQFGTFDYVRTDPSMGLVYATSDSATGAVLANSGPVTQFLIRTPGGGGGSGGPGGGVAPVPEPATWAMMILGFGGVGLLQRRRMRLAMA